MKALLFCVFGICTLTLNAADLTPQQLAAADKVAHSYMEAWMAGDYEKTIVLSDVGNAFGTANRVAGQVTKYYEIVEILEWIKPEVCEDEFVAIRFVANVKFKGEAKKEDWWLGLALVGDTWKVCYTNPLLANRPHSLKSTTKRKAAVKDDAFKAYQNSLQSCQRLLESHKAKATATDKPK